MSWYATPEMVMTFGLTYENSFTNNDCWRCHNLERTHNWCSAVGKAAF